MIMIDKEYEVLFLILNYKTYQDTILLVREIMQFKYFGDKYGVLIVDNDSPNESWIQLRNNFAGEKGVFLLQNHENGGYAKGNNVGLYSMAHSSPKYVCIINNDVHFSENTIEHLIGMYELLPNAGMIAPIQVLPNGNKVQMSYKMPSLIADLNSTLPINLLRNSYGEYQSNTQWPNVEKVDIIQGAFIFTNYSLFKSLGFFDDRTFLFCEERICAFKMKKAKRNNYLILDCTYLHQHSLTISSEASKMRQRKYMLHGRLVYARYYRKFPLLCTNLLKLVYIISYPFVWIKYKLKSLVSG